MEVNTIFSLYAPHYNIILQLLMVLLIVKCINLEFTFSRLFRYLLFFYFQSSNWSIRSVLIFGNTSTEVTFKISNMLNKWTSFYSIIWEKIVIFTNRKNRWCFLLNCYGNCNHRWILNSCEDIFHGAIASTNSSFYLDYRSVFDGKPFTSSDLVYILVLVEEC